MKKIATVALFLLISPAVLAQKWKCSWKDVPQQEFAYEITVSTQPKLVTLKSFWREDDGSIGSQEEVLLDDEHVYKPVRMRLANTVVREENSARAYHFSWNSRDTVYGSLELNRERADGSFASYWDWNGSTVSRVSFRELPPDLI